jgi:hypothetical protein
MELCKYLCELRPIILRISDPTAVQPAHVTLWIQGEADEMLTRPSPFGLGIDKPKVPRRGKSGDAEIRMQPRPRYQRDGDYETRVSKVCPRDRGNVAGTHLNSAMSPTIHVDSG